MSLTLYNTLTRTKETFTPADPKRVTMYNCGPTVYSYAHIGNARAAVAADVLFRVLRHIYGEDHVVYARNLTDVDDKIIAAAKEQGVPMREITEKYARIYNEDLAALNCLPPTHQPKATDNISGMIAIIEILLADGYAYESQGHVFFDVSKYADYGKLSGNTLEALKQGDRVGEAELACKRNSADFVLWKPELDGVGWDAPFGSDGSNMKGRPGWHIECSAMAKETLGETIDIHCGGVDLKFPHHENEIAQSNCAHGKPMAKYWVHNEFLNMGKDKMSKSLGNVKLVHDLLEGWDGEVIRLALLKAHYRSELIWTDDLLKEAKRTLDSLYRALYETMFVEVDEMLVNLGSLNGLLDDLNTVEAFSLVNGLKKELVSIDEYEKNFDLPDGNVDIVSPNLKDFEISFQKNIREKIIGIGNLLGLLQKDPEEWFKGGLNYDGLVAEYDVVRAQALEAKKEGDKAKMGALFKRSDEIRDQFAQEGVVIESGADGKSTWRKS